MKDPIERTKVVVRRLPPAISEAALVEQIDGRFAGRYNWLCFRPGNSSQKNQRHSRAYINFNRPEDVVEFAEIFDGHIFVNEKGAQYKAVIEYAPSQRVPKESSKKDGREGTIYKDPEYLEFLELLAKPENLPSAEIQLERKEAERAAAPKDSVIVTPLMEYVRQRRAAKSGPQRSANGRSGRRAGRASPSSASPSKRSSEKNSLSKPQYIWRDSKKGGSGKGKSAYVAISRKDELQSIDKSNAGTGNLEDETGTEIGKKRVILLKAKDKEGTPVSGGSSQQQTSGGNLESSAFNKSQRHGVAGGKITSILSKDVQHNVPQTQAVNMNKDKRPPRPPNFRLILRDQITAISSGGDAKRYQDANSAVECDSHGSEISGEKLDKRTRGKDRGDRAVWAPLRRSDGSHPREDTPPSSFLEGYEETRSNVSNSSKAAEVKILRGGRADLISKNGPHKHGRRGPPHGMKEIDSSLTYTDGKPSKRGNPGGHGLHERQVWVQKSGPGS
uniref:UPF3 domain-containing protein n=1 Tax=Ananas comosus var. bracteatus TaxID=296719 RepID=A0A6V7Q7Q1_ANACO|nr:unnamed protein product [Ananas comosus var. bracteatus]